MRRVRRAKAVLWAILGAAAVVTVSRFLHGLGASTALTDRSPWGFWVGFDVMGGVALAAGGFVLAAVVYVLRRAEYKPVVRAAVLTAMLGYMAVVVGLLYDLGLPWNIWHMIVFWNPKSPLFEVGWCVMLYLTVLIIEFLPVVLELSERPLLRKIHGVLSRYSLVFVFLGIMLSTLHQSSLGSLFLIQPHRLPPLWYTPLLPVLFFVSAVALGLLMVTAESLTTSWLYERPPELKLLSGLAKGAFWVLALYAVLRVGDLVYRGAWAEAFRPTYSARLFWAEMLISTVVPLVLLAIPRARGSAVGLGIASGLGVFGVAFNRLNVGGIAMVEVAGLRYVPSWTEILVSAGVVAAAVLVFFYCVEHFRVWETPAFSREQWEVRPPRFDPATLTWERDPAFGDTRRNAVVFVLGAAFAFALLPEDARSGPAPRREPVARARGGSVLLIDGDRDGDLVRFDHRKHEQKVAKGNACGTCHHMVLPRDQGTACAACHRDMNGPTDIFDHRRHVAAVGGTRGCARCHRPGVPKTARTAKACGKCHDQMVPRDARVRPKTDRFRVAPGYVAALHGLCVGCHREQVVRGSKPKAFAYCGQCHRTAPVTFDPERPHHLPRAVPFRQPRRPAAAPGAR